MQELLEQPDVLLARVGAVRVALAATAGRSVEEIELKLAASVAQLGLVARLIAPGLAVAALTGRPLASELPMLWWQDELGGPFPLSVAEPLPVGPASRPAGRDGGETQLIDGPVAALTSAVASLIAVSGRVLWGNVASALNSATNLAANQRPDLAARLYAIGTATLADPRLASEPGVPGPAFRRTSCCLIYRAAPPGPAGSAPVCADCVLAGRN